MNDSIILTDDSFTISQLSVTNKDSGRILTANSRGRESLQSQKRLRVGLFCLERGQQYSRSRVCEATGSRFTTEGRNCRRNVPAATERALLSKIGTDNGQVLAPVKSLIETSSATAKTRLDEVRNLLTNDLDPRSGTSTLGLALTKITASLRP